LTDENKAARVHYALDQINKVTVDSMVSAKYDHMYDRVHIDEKWFFLSQDGEFYILAAGEEPPKRFTKHKSHIEKVMFLCAQARPRMDYHTKRMWDGKIGIWPIGEYSEALRDSKHRKKGTPVWKNQNVDKDKYRQLLMDKVVPAILSLWPMGELKDTTRKIIIQQDGAKSHIHPADEAWKEYLRDMDLGLEDKIIMQTQPANSPDTNLNDLGFFSALQAQYYDHAPNNSLELISMVEKVFKEFDYKVINRIWLTYMTCLNEIVKHNGCNQYKIPHLGKVKLEREGKLPVTIEVCKEALDLLEMEG
jgi:hypothetical protein